MKVTELENINITKSTAYVLGLIYPLRNTKNVYSKAYVVGSINHNANMITDEEITKHYLAVHQLLNAYDETSGVDLKTNKSDGYKISSKKGFSILIEIPDDCTEFRVNQILTDCVIRLQKESSEIKKEFIKGCFDGRSSWDTTAHYLSIDVDRDAEKQKLIYDIARDVGLDLNINARGDGHPKNDQIRIKKHQIRFYMENIGLYSTKRTSLVNKGMQYI